MTDYDKGFNDCLHRVISLLNKEMSSINYRGKVSGIIYDTLLDFKLLIDIYVVNNKIPNHLRELKNERRENMDRTI